MIKYISFTLLILSLTGCVSTYKSDAVVTSDIKLDSTQGVLIATPANGQYNGEIYSNSGQATAMAVRSAFLRKTSIVDVLSECNELNCLMTSADGSYGYLVVPVILHWEDRATEWSGMKDKLEYKISVYSIDGTLLSSTLLSGKSKWATFGGDHPQDLLPAPTKRYIESLY